MYQSIKPYISIFLLLFFTVLLYITSITYVKNSINEVIEGDAKSYADYIYEELIENVENSVSNRSSFINNLFLGVRSDIEMISRLKHLDDSLRYRLFDHTFTEIKSSNNSQDLYVLTSDDLSMFNKKIITTKPILTSDDRLLLEFFVKIVLEDNTYYLVMHIEDNPSSLFRMSRVPPHLQVRIVHKSGHQLHPPTDFNERRPNNPKRPSDENHPPPPHQKEQGFGHEKSSVGTVINYSKEIDIIESTLLIDFFADDIYRTYLPILWIFRLTILLSFLIFLSLTIFINGGRLRAFDYNSLTHLPGNRSIVRQIERRLRTPSDHMIIYCDLDNFKAYNDVYGFSSGDQVILFYAKMLKHFFSRLTGAFVGHIGGDDFVIIGLREQLIIQAEEFGKEFDKTISKFYNETDRERGYISTRDRKGDICNFPLISMSMGGVELRHYPSEHYLKVAEICAEVKKEAKKQAGSTLYIDKRVGFSFST